MQYTIVHRKYHHQVVDPFKHPNTAPYWVTDAAEQTVVVIREAQGFPDEEGFDLRLDCLVADDGMRTQVDAYFGIRCTTPVWLARPDGRMIAG
jgi:hypothetical protein